MPKLTLADALSVLPVVGPGIAAAREFKAIWDAAVETLNPTDQDTAKAGYDDLMAENDEGFARLDAKLEAAKNR